MGWIVWMGILFNVAIAQDGVAAAPDPWAEPTSDCPEGGDGGEGGGCSELPFDPNAAPEGAGNLDFSEAVETSSLSADELQEFKPKLHLLPQNPRAQTDFTAYTLEQGEVKIGLNMTIGLFDNAQLGSNVVFDVLGVPNFNIKIDAIQEGPVHIGVSGGRYWLVQDDYLGSYTPLETIASWNVIDGWSVHGGVSYNMFSSEGVVDLDAISPLFAGSIDDTIDSVGGDLDLHLYANTVQARFATDYRFNRRDSLIAQVRSTVYSQIAMDTTIQGQEISDDDVIEQIPDVFGLREVLSSDGFKEPLEFYSASLAWQFRWKRAELRFGLGWSEPLLTSWLQQSFEFTYRLGGETRRREARQRKTWRQNRRDAKSFEGEAAE